MQLTMIEVAENNSMLHECFLLSQFYTDTFIVFPASSINMLKS